MQVGGCPQILESRGGEKTRRSVVPVTVWRYLVWRNRFCYLFQLLHRSPRWCSARVSYEREIGVVDGVVDGQMAPYDKHRSMDSIVGAVVVLYFLSIGLSSGEYVFKPSFILYPAAKVQTSFRQNASSIGRWGRSATNPVTIPGSTASGTADVGYAYTLTGSPSPPNSPPINMPPPIPPRPVIRQSSFTKIGYMINTAVNGTKKQFSSSNSGSGNGGR